MILLLWLTTFLKTAEAVKRLINLVGKTFKFVLDDQFFNEDWFMRQSDMHSSNLGVVKVVYGFLSLFVWLNCRGSAIHPTDIGLMELNRRVSAYDFSPPTLSATSTNDHLPKNIAWFSLNHESNNRWFNAYYLFLSKVAERCTSSCKLICSTNIEEVMYNIMMWSIQRAIQVLKIELKHKTI